MRSPTNTYNLSLIAIMLGRLHMDIQPCIDAYSELSRCIFSEKGIPVDWRGHVKGKFKATKLEEAVKEIIKGSGSPEDTLLDDGKGRGCRVYVDEPKELENRADISQIRVRSQEGEQSCGPPSRLSLWHSIDGRRRNNMGSRTGNIGGIQFL